MAGISEPAWPVGDERPRPHFGDTRGEEIDPAIGAILSGHMTGKPIVRNEGAARHKTEDRKHEFRMRRRWQLSIVRNLAAFPQAGNFGTRARGPQNVGVAPGNLKHQLVDGERCAYEPLLCRPSFKRSGELRDRRKVEIRAAPLQLGHIIETVFFQRFGKGGVKGLATACRAKSPVAVMASRTPSNLAKFGGGQAPMLPAIELAVGGKSNVIDIEIEAHADCIGGDDVINIPALKQFDLGVARARRKGAENDSCAAVLAPDPFRDGVNILNPCLSGLLT